MSKYFLLKGFSHLSKEDGREVERYIEGCQIAKNRLRRHISYRSYFIPLKNYNSLNDLRGRPHLASFSKKIIDFFCTELQSLILAGFFFFEKIK